MLSVPAKDNQTLFDIAVQELGSVERVFDLARLNGLCVTDTLKNGQLINTSLAVDVGDQDCVNYFKNRQWKPSTGEGNTATPEGIGYWYLEFDFKVS